MKRDPAFIIDLIDTAIMLAAILVAQAVFIAVSQIMAQFLDGQLLEIIAYLPKFNYAIIDGQEYGNYLHDLYAQFQWAAILVLIGIVIVCGIVRLATQADIGIDKMAWDKRLKSAIFAIIIILAFPFFWDSIAFAMETGTLYMLNPLYSFDSENPCPASWSDQEIIDKYNESPYARDGIAQFWEKEKAEIVCHPQLRVHYVISQLAGHTSYELPEDSNPLETLISFVSQATTGAITTVTLGIIKSLVIMQVVLMSVLIGIFADMLTAMIITGLPLFLVIRMIPGFAPPIDKFLTSLPALYMVPLMSAIILHVGAAFIASAGDTDFAGEIVLGIDLTLIYVWISAMAVLIFAVAIPMVLVPLLSDVTKMANSMITSALRSASMITVGMGMGAAKGMMGGGGMAGRMKGMVAGGGKGGLGALGGGDDEGGDDGGDEGDDGGDEGVDDEGNEDDGKFEDGEESEELEDEEK